MSQFFFSYGREVLTSGVLVLALALASCTKPSAPTNTTTPAEVKPLDAQPTALKKTLTRKEMEAWLSGSDGTKSANQWKTGEKDTADVKARVGKPVATYEEKSKRGTDYLIYRYEGLTVDANGSGKTDRETLIYFELYKERFERIEYNP